MKSRCGFYSTLEYCEGIVEEFGEEVGELGGEAPPPVDETLHTIWYWKKCSFYCDH